MAAGDLTTLAAVKEQMDTPATGADAQITALIPRASRAIHRWTGREFATLTAGEHVRDFDLALWREVREVPVGDMQSPPTAVAYLDEDGTVASTLTVATAVVALPLYRPPGEPVTRLRLRASAGSFGSRQQLRVTGLWGWPSVPADVEQACIVTVRSWLRSDSASSGSFGIEEGRVVQSTPEGGWMLPMAAKQLLRPYRPLLGMA